MNLHELQPEKLFQAARLVFQEKSPLRAVSSSDKPKADAPSAKGEAAPGEKADKKVEKKDAPKKVGSVEIRNAARARARQFKDNQEVLSALEKMENAEKRGDVVGKMLANHAAGELMEVLIMNRTGEDKNLDYWYQEAKNNARTAMGIESQKTYEQEEQEAAENREREEKQKKQENTTKYEGLLTEITTLDADLKKATDTVEALDNNYKKASDAWVKDSNALHESRLALDKIPTLFGLTPVYRRRADYYSLENKIKTLEGSLVQSKKLLDEAFNERKNKKPGLEAKITELKEKRPKLVEEKDKLKEALGITGEDKSQLPPSAPKATPSDSTVLSLSGNDRKIEDLTVDDIEVLTVKKSG